MPRPASALCGPTGGLEQEVGPGPLLRVARLKSAALRSRGVVPGHRPWAKLGRALRSPKAPAAAACGTAGRRRIGSVFQAAPGRRHRPRRTRRLRRRCIRPRAWPRADPRLRRLATALPPCPDGRGATAELQGPRSARQ